MYSLFLDTTQKHCHLAILKNDNFIKTRSVPVNNNLTDIVVEHINQLLNECEIDKKNIGCLYFLNGPGSFTGIRVATLIAKTWLLVNKTQVFVMDALKFQIMSKSGISVLDARGDKIYVSVVKNNKIVVKPKIINVFELNNLIIKYKQLKIYKYFENSDVFKNLLFHLDDFCLVDDINKLQPLYIKVPI